MVYGCSLKEFVFIIISACAIAGSSQYDHSTCDAQCNFDPGLFTLLFLSPHLFFGCFFLHLYSFFIRLLVSSGFRLATDGILYDLLHGRINFGFHLWLRLCLFCLPLPDSSFRLFFCSPILHFCGYCSLLRFIFHAAAAYIRHKREYLSIITQNSTTG